MNNIYYVYEWIRLDTNEPFYVGKGKNNRCYIQKRQNNPYFNNIVKLIDCAVVILHKELTEEEALQYEIWYINEYKNEIGYDLVNITDGGDGVSGYKATEEANKKNRMIFHGFDIEDYTDEIIDMYMNKNMSTVDIGDYLKVSKRPINRILKKNNISIRTSGETLSINATGIKRYNAKCIIIKDLNNNIIELFESQAMCAEWLCNLGIAKSKKGGIHIVSDKCNTDIYYKDMLFFSCDKNKYLELKMELNKT